MPMSELNQDTIIVSGANGYIASMFITRMLYSSNKNIIALVRSLKAEEQCYTRIENELHHQGLSLRDIMPNRIKVIIIDVKMRVKELSLLFPKGRVKQFFHAAGCKDCFDMRLLTDANVKYTLLMLSLAKKIDVEHFYYLSTTYSVGFRNHEIHEIFYDDLTTPVSNYALTMRQAERIVHDAGHMKNSDHMKTTIIRVSNVIGDSQTGHYSGKNYGLYACWSDLAEFIVNHEKEQLHIISTNHKVNLVHQDVLMDMLYDISRTEFQEEVIHITSNYDSSPTIEELWKMWLSSVSDFKYVCTYEEMTALPFKDTTHFQQHALRRVYLFLSVAANKWHFSNDKMKLIGSTEDESVTVDSVENCLNYTFRNNPRLKGKINEVEVLSENATYLSSAS